MKRLKIILVPVLSLLGIGLFAQGIDFKKGHLDDVLALAEKENKLVFVDVYTTWCGPCKQMDRDVFPLDEIGAFYNTNFINYKLDAENSEFNGPAIAQKYDVKGFPTYLFLNGEGTVQTTVSGAMPADLFLKTGQKALGVEVDADYKIAAAKYANGDRSDEAIKSYILAANEYARLIYDENEEEGKKAMSGANEATALYLKRSPEKFVNKEDFTFISDQSVYYAQKLFRGHKLTEYVVDHYDDFKAIVSDENELANFLMYMNYFGIREAASAGEQKRYKQYIADITGKLKPAYAFNDESKLKAIPFLTAFGEAEYAVSQKDYNNYIDNYEAILEMKNDLGAIDYLMPARRILGGGDYSIKQLKRCIKFNQIAYDQYKNAYVVTDFGKLMAKLGDADKARVYYEEAFALFEAMGERGEKMVERFKKEMVALNL